MQKTKFAYEETQIDYAPPESDITSTPFQIEGELVDMTEMTCSQLLQQMIGTQGSTWDANDDLSRLMNDLPVVSYTRLLTTPNFEVRKS